MKRIYLIRHAKSDWAIPDLKDIDRALNQRGYRDAHRIGAHFKDKIPGSILFISSPAIRAISTALIFANEINYEKSKIVIEENLYEAEEHVYIKLFPTLDEKYDTVLIFGHNPTISNVYALLTGRNINDFPTCSVSVIQFEADKWNQISKSVARTELQIFPAHLNE